MTTYCVQMLEEWGQNETGALPRKMSRSAWTSILEMKKINNQIKAGETLFLTQPHSTRPGLWSLTQTLRLCVLGALVSSKPTCRSKGERHQPLLTGAGSVHFFLDLKFCFIKHTCTYTYSPRLWIAAKSISLLHLGKTKKMPGSLEFADYRAGLK